MVLPATAQRTGGKCMPCFKRHEELLEIAWVSEHRPKGDYEITSYNSCYDTTLRDVSLRERGVERLCLFIHFLQENGLTERPILEPGMRPDKSTRIWAADLTEEGLKLVESAYHKWLESQIRAKTPGDVSVLERALAQIRQVNLTRKKGRASAHKRIPKEKLASAKETCETRASGAAEKSSSKGSRVRPTWTKEFEESWRAAGPHVYDKAKWHYEGDYPEGLPAEQAFVHTGMIIAWLIEHDMIEEDFLPEAEQFKRREITGAGAYKIWDGVLADDMLTEEGNQFARNYYGEAFEKDYTKVLVGKLPSFYHVKDTWKNYRALKALIDQRYEAWKVKSQAKK